ncbi:hypothetical protein QNA08_13785 [Chelatococcus sp. SYSU_G07232]|uniref:Lipoprotein n=1 Tax=Chelatococcus albus TaxID=3047466 RepID=A0ABT7AIV0_9HYPH|nr:hypothetical protein [Chelatococcus sp. SYSU_G07232]MDJ1159306.1 hypothetical protein [Chelatococcus sp. SYSU_G07232]
MFEGRTAGRPMLAAALCSLALAGCQEGGVSGAGLAGKRIEAPGVPVAVESIEGAPEPVMTRLASALVDEASARRVELVSDKGNARYRVKGYLTAYTTENGATALTFVWDVFDETKRRAQRLEGTSVAKTPAGTDPWSGVDQGAVAKVASESMNAIAGFLSQSGRSSAAPVATASAEDTATGLGFATAE